MDGTTATERIDTVVIGAGQAGLSGAGCAGASVREAGVYR